MSVTKDTKIGKWMSQICVKDWTGNTIHKKKRGFSTKKEALQWEWDFISQATASLEMTFHDFIESYLKDMEGRLKPSTIANKRFLIDLKITPYFCKMPLDAIQATDIHNWQNTLTSYRDEKGTLYSATYLKTINSQITALFNYAVKYYGLKENPCHKAGSMGKKNADEMLFWTKEEFASFIEVMQDRPTSYAVFMTLYYTGMRESYWHLPWLMYPSRKPPSPSIRDIRDSTAGILSPLPKRQRATGSLPYLPPFAIASKSICSIATTWNMRTGCFPTQKAFSIKRWSMAARLRG